ncbi:MAG: hypothetical protein KDJ75_09560 [Alphaproteobacteria bacterium]|nr:hypothetical protein [Alphaproteobacteria bacterium]
MKKEFTASTQAKEYTVILPNSAGYAIDGIGMAAFWGKENGHKVTLMADQRLSGLASSIQDTDIHVGIPYTREQGFPSSPKVTQAQIDYLEQSGHQSKDGTISLKQIAEEVGESVPLTETLAGLLPARPFQWINAQGALQEQAQDVLGSVIEQARAESGKPQAQPFFVFYWGGKARTDTERSPDRQRIGGILKSVDASLVAEQVAVIQKRAIEAGRLVIPVFAQYGNPDDLNERLGTHNESFEVAGAVRPVDWNAFEEPAALIQAAKQYGFIATGNLDTTHHLFWAAAEPAQGKAHIIGLEKGYVFDRRWHVAASRSNGGMTVLRGPNYGRWDYGRLMGSAMSDPETVLRIAKEEDRAVTAKLSQYALMQMEPEMARPWAWAAEKLPSQTML